MMVARVLRVLVSSALLCGAATAAASNPSTVSFGTIPAAPAVAALEFPVAPGLAAEVDFLALTLGAYDDKNPFANLSGVAPGAWLHFDRVANLRLSAGYQQLFYFDVAPGRQPHSLEERAVLRARLQQPRGAAALYEMVQLDVMGFDDPTGTRRLQLRPRFRVGQGFNLDAVRIHSLVLYQEVALRYGEPSYFARAFEFFRAFAGYTWTTRRGTFVTLGLVGQISLNPAATAYTFLVGPALGVEYRFREAPPETPLPPPEVEVE